jgi:ligand-binding sensor domain-containing protein/signal transduction histidine kinase
VQTRKHAVSRPLLRAMLLLACVGLRAQQLPIKTYTTSDGLPRNGINNIVRDSHGFLWFCTLEGLSRFDGYTFTNYGVEQGVPDRMVTDLIETRGGEYWIATFNGLARFNPNGVPANAARDKKADKRRTGPRFVNYPTNWLPNARYVVALLEDRDGTIWFTTTAGLGHLQKVGGQWQIRAVDLGPLATDVNPLLQDKDGALWIGTYAHGLYRRWPDGRVERYAGRNGLPYGPGEHDHQIRALLEDRNGRLWVGTNQGLFQLVLKPAPGQSVIARTFTTKQGLPHNLVNALMQSSDGEIWIGTLGGLAELSSEGNTEGWKLTSYPAMSKSIDAFVEDRDRNLWMGTGIGAMRLARNGFTTYGANEGFGDKGVNSIFEDQAGEVCVINKLHNKLTLHRFDGTRFESVPFNLPPRITYLGWGWNQIALQDHAGEWWLATGQGLCRYPRVTRFEALAFTPPLAIYTSNNGMGGDEVFRIYEDFRRDVWVSGAGIVTRWERATQTFHAAELHEGVSAFAEDRLGNLWMGFMLHDLARYRDGRFTLFTPAEGLPEGSIYSLLVDHLGRLWIGSNRGGVAKVDNLGAERPRFIKFPGTEGLSDTDVECLTEDRWGRIYIGTGHGLYRLDPETGRTKRYTAAEGLAGDPNVAFSDRNGVLWFGSSEGLSRLVPELEKPESHPRPPIRITALRVAGIPYPVSELGETRLAGLVLEPTQNDLQVDFASLNFGVGEVLRYQFRLEGGGEDWSPPTDQRSINLARLASGEYRLQVRAVNGDGMASAAPATISFKVLAPVWRRAWFLAAAGLLMALAVYGFYRYRLAQRLELEHVRTRIATDLHDDIGSSLSGMAFLSEAVKRQMGSSRPEAFEMVSEVAAMARGLARSLSDVVWSIDPQRDDLNNVITRVRQSAAVLESQGIAWLLEAPPQPEKVKLTPEQRHHLFLIFKEALNNIARHAHCTSASLTITVGDHKLHAEIVDDGCGFGSEEHQGNGLRNMKLRAEQLGGRIIVDSAAGRGVRLNLTVPLK